MAIKNKPTTGPFNKDTRIIDNDNNILNASPFVEVVPSEDEDIVSPFDRGSIGTLDNILNTSPFGYEIKEDEGGIIVGRAYYVLQPPQQINNGGFIDLKGPLQIIPIEGTNEQTVNIINQIPFGNVGIEPGSTVTLYGTSDTLLAKMVSNAVGRFTDYGVWLNGSVTFYKGYSIQLQLVKMGTLNIWLQISKNF